MNNQVIEQMDLFAGQFILSGPGSSWYQQGCKVFPLAIRRGSLQIYDSVFNATVRNAQGSGLVYNQASYLQNIVGGSAWVLDMVSRNINFGPSIMFDPQTFNTNGGFIKDQSGANAQSIVCLIQYQF